MTIRVDEIELDVVDLPISTANAHVCSVPKGFALVYSAYSKPAQSL